MDFLLKPLASYKVEIQLVIVFLISLCGYGIIAYFLKRSQFAELLVLVGIAFAAYVWAIHCYRQKTRILGLGIAAAIAFRLIFIASVPALSDDYFRFLWDGRLCLAGVNPFEFRPEELLINPIYNQLNLNELYNGLNSKLYFSVYPPISQGWFVWAAWWGSQNVLAELIALRSVLLLAEAGTVFLLFQFTKQFQLPYYTPLLYALNPLIIIELTGNLHFEAVQIFFLLLALYYLVQQHLWASSLGFALAVSSKLVPLIFLPLLFFKLGFGKGFLYCVRVGIITGLFFVSFLDLEIIYKISSSVNLYFQTFEFNASIYYLIREIGFGIKGYNIIETSGKVLSLLSLTLILGYSFYQQKSTNFFLPFTCILLIYYALATTVHPWYISNVLIFAILSSQYWAIVWTFLGFLSYHAYSYQPYREQLWLVLLEYSLLLLCAILYTKRKTISLYIK